MEQEPNVHFLKIHKQYFQQIKKRSKRYELRKDDRGAMPGDYFILQEFDDEKKEYTGSQQLVYVSGKLVSAPKFGLKDGYAIFDIKFPEEIEDKKEEIDLILRKILIS